MTSSNNVNKFDMVSPSDTLSLNYNIEECEEYKENESKLTTNESLSHTPTTQSHEEALLWEESTRKKNANEMLAADWKLEQQHEQHLQELLLSCEKEKIMQMEVKKEKERESIKSSTLCKAKEEEEYQRQYWKQKEYKEKVKCEEKCSYDYHCSGIVVKAENLPPYISKDVFRMLFWEYSLFHDGQILLLQSNTNKFEGYIVLSNLQEAEWALSELSESELWGYIVRLKIVPEEEYTAALKKIIAFLPSSEHLFSCKYRCRKEYGVLDINTTSNNSNNNNSNKDGSTVNMPTVATNSISNTYCKSNLCSDNASKVEKFVIHLRGFPFDASEQHIKSFLESISDVERMEFALFSDNSFSGQCFVEISSWKGVEQAFKLNKRIMGRRYIEVMLCSIQERESIKNDLKNRTSSSSRVNRPLQPRLTNATNRRNYEKRETDFHLQNLTYEQNKRDNTRQLTFDQNARRITALVETRKTPLHAVLQSNHSHTPYNFAVNESFQPMSYPQMWMLHEPNSMLRQMQSINNASSWPQTYFNTPKSNYLPTWCGGSNLYQNTYHNANPPMLNSNLLLQQPVVERRQFIRPSPYVVRVRGIPFTATEAEIASQFFDVWICPCGIHMVLDEYEKLTGEVFIEVCSYEDVQQALQHDREYMGHRYLEVFWILPQQMRRYKYAYGNIPPNETS